MDKSHGPDWTASVTTAEALTRISASGVRCGRVATPAEALDQTDATIPRLGAHRRELLGEIGIDETNTTP